MFIETPKDIIQYGWIEVVCGCMFSGKTEELIRRINQARDEKFAVAVCKPKTDTRYSVQNIVSHNEKLERACIIDHAEEIYGLAQNADVIAVDEAQFFDSNIVKVANDLANKGKRVIVAGLDMDSEGNPFGPMPYLMAIAEYVTKLHAVCAVSGQIATFTKRLKKINGQILLGDSSVYEPRNRKYFFDN